MGAWCLVSSSTRRVISLARSKPSVSTRGWTPDGRWDKKWRTLTLGNVLLGELEEFTNEKNGRRSAIAGDVILRRARLADHGRRWVLNVLQYERCGMFQKQFTHHFVQQHIAVLRQLQVAGAGNQPRNDVNDRIMKCTHILIVPLGPRFDFITS